MTRGLALETVFIPIEAKGSSSMPPPKADGLLLVAVTELNDGFAPTPPMFEKAKALSSASSSLHPSSLSSPQPSSTAGAGFGALSDAEANC